MQAVQVQSPSQKLSSQRLELRRKSISTLGAPVKFLVTQSWLEEQERLTRFEAFIQSHQEDCYQVRKETAERMLQLETRIAANHMEWKEIVEKMDERNTSTLRSAIKLLAAILVALLGYIGSQAYERLYPRLEASSAARHSTILHPPGE